MVVSGGIEFYCFILSLSYSIDRSAFSSGYQSHHTTQRVLQILNSNLAGCITALLSLSEPISMTRSAKVWEWRPWFVPPFGGTFDAEDEKWNSKPEVVLRCVINIISEAGWCQAPYLFRWTYLMWNLKIENSQSFIHWGGYKNFEVLSQKLIQNSTTNQDVLVWFTSISTENGRENEGYIEYFCYICAFI